MNILEGIVLGLTQGLTEFLPVSSSGHLILMREFFGIELKNSLAFDVFLNTATLLAVVFCFWPDLKNLTKKLADLNDKKTKKLFLNLIIATIPAGLVGFLYSDKIENLFRAGENVALALIIGSLIMFFADRIKKDEELSPVKSLIIGIFQALALIPGISRSGATISGGLLARINREEAIRFSFLLLIPVSLGALFKIGLDIENIDFENFLSLPYLLAFLTALLSGIWSVRFLISYLSKNSFVPFIIYRTILALIILFMF